MWSGPSRDNSIEGTRRSVPGVATGRQAELAMIAALP